MTISERAVQDMPARERPISEQFRLAGLEWADANAAANILEETKSAELSKRIRDYITAHGPMPFNRAEAEIKGSPEWIEHLKLIANTRHRADRSRIQMDYMRMRHTEWMNANANNRAEQRLGR